MWIALRSVVPLIAILPGALLADVCSQAFHSKQEGDFKVFETDQGGGRVKDAVGKDRLLLDRHVRACFSYRSPSEGADDEGRFNPRRSQTPIWLREAFGDGGRGGDGETSGPPDFAGTGWRGPATSDGWTPPHIGADPSQRPENPKPFAFDQTFGDTDGESGGTLPGTASGSNPTNPGASGEETGGLPPGPPVVTEDPGKLTPVSCPEPAAVVLLLINGAVLKLANLKKARA